MEECTEVWLGGYPSVRLLVKLRAWLILKLLVVEHVLAFGEGYMGLKLIAKLGWRRLKVEIAVEASLTIIVATIRPFGQSMLSSSKTIWDLRQFNLKVSLR